jgi:putative transposase
VPIISAKGDGALAPAMSKPARPSKPDHIGRERQFFVTTKAAGGRAIFQTERMASLLVDVLRKYTQVRRFVVSDFVVMPDHVHILVTVPSNMSIERVVQLVKGNFSFRAPKELGFVGEVWQRGFSDVRITSSESLRQHRVYLDENPVKAGLAQSPAEYAYSSASLRRLKRAGANAPPATGAVSARLKSCPDTSA